MKHIFKLLMFTMLVVLVSCQTDYSGTEKMNQAPQIDFSSYDSTKLYLTKKKTRISWYANDVDGTKMTYYYVVTPDSTITGENLLIHFPYGSSSWKSTTNSFADVSFLVDGQNLKEVNFENPDNHVITKYVRSKIFIYGLDENSNKTRIITRTYWRTNTRPQMPKVECPSFNWTASATPPMLFRPYQATPLPRLFLPAATNFWQPIGFRWRSQDDDGADVALEFKWSIRKINALPGAIDPTTLLDGDTMSVLYPENTDRLITESDWSESNVELQVFSTMLDGPGYYKLVIKVRDDAGQESVDKVINVFEAFNPTFNKGILVLDRTLGVADLPGYGLQKGYPHQDSVAVVYKKLLESAGLHPSTSDTTNQLRSYDFRVVNDTTIFLTKELTQYRLILLYSDSRDKKDDMFSTILEGGFGSSLDLYTQMGGKVFVVGKNMILNKPITTNYDTPNRFTDLNDFVANKFGLATYTCGEGYQEKPGTDWHNYDFAGAKSFAHTPDLIDMKVDKSRINLWWKRQNASNDYVIKGGGAFIPGIATVSARAGEIIFGYESVYDNADMQNDPALITAGATGYPTKPVLNRNEFNGVQAGTYSALGNRYIAPFDAFRSAYIGLPLYFMDDSEGAVTHNFIAMIDWFELGKNPLDNQKK